MEKPLVSVVINTYNHKDYISQAIESALMQQTTFPFEIIVGDDESNDGTREICIDYAEKYPNKIRLFLRSRKDVIHIDGRPTGRRNFIENLKSAEGKYVALIPGDDYWTDPLKLQKQVDFMEVNPKCFMINHAMPSFGKSKEGWYNLDQLFQKGYLPHASNYLFRRFDLNKYRQPLLNMLGGEMCLLYIAASEGLIYHSSQPVSFYRINPNGIYSSKTNIQKILGKAFQIKLIKRYFNVDSQTYLRRRLQAFKEASLINKKYLFHVMVYKYLSRAYSLKNRYYLKLKSIRLKYLS